MHLDAVVSLHAFANATAPLNPLGVGRSQAGKDCPRLKGDRHPKAMPTGMELVCGGVAHYKNWYAVEAEFPCRLLGVSWDFNRPKAIVILMQVLQYFPKPFLIPSKWVFPSIRLKKHYKRST